MNRGELRKKTDEIIYGSVSEITWVQARAITDKLLALPEVKKLEMWDELIIALETISEGKGRYSKDPLIHCSNTVEDMKKIAVDILAKAKAINTKVNFEKPNKGIIKKDGHIWNG